MTRTTSMQTALATAALLVMLLLAATDATAADTAPGPWWTGRATFYGGPTDYWNINHGSCGYGYLDPNKATGLMIAAMADADVGFEGSCGRCFEVGCADFNFTDGYGEKLSRSNVCYNENATVVVQVTDACPCNYAANAYSNKRWCCGDMYHLDLSIWAFEMLADTKWGVVGLKLRWVPCNYQPANPARQPANPTPANSPPSGWSSNMDKRPWPQSK